MFCKLFCSRFHLDKVGCMGGKIYATADIYSRFSCPGGCTCLMRVETIHTGCTYFLNVPFALDRYCSDVFWSGSQYS